MLIILGGASNSGIKHLAKSLAKLRGMHHYDLDRHRVHDHFFTRKKEMVERVVYTHSDTERMRIFRLAVQDFRMLSKLHSDVIIYAGFNRTQSREYLFTHARRYFNPVIFVWIDADEKHVTDRIKRLYRRGLVESVESELQERELSKQEFEPFKVSPPTFHYGGNPGESAAQLWELIRKIRKEGQMKSFWGS